MTSVQQTCSHASLVADVSPNGHQAGYKRIDWERRTAATTRSGRVQKITSEQEGEQQSFSFAYPAPLVLPGDELACDPKYPPQSFRSWKHLKERNKVACNRKTIFVAGNPKLCKELSDMAEWTVPAGSKRGSAKPEVQSPQFDDVLEYLRAFYHGFEVKSYTHDLTFVPWKNSSAKGSFVGLKEGPSDTYTRIQIRPSPDGLFSHQLNLNDLLDCAIDILPDDAYALLILVDYDLYEDEDDDFCCGRAYGGSRVAVVSSARYNPFLFSQNGIETHHIWPASHCAEYVASQCNLSSKKKKKKTPNRNDHMSDSALHKAVAAFKASLSTSSRQPDYLHGLWLFCLARTASHELGHCFSMDHCVYYACVMQGTASVAEDLRQPPYLCPICAKKLAQAVEEGSETRFDEERYMQEAVAEMMVMCEKWKHVGVWAGYEAWLRRLISSHESV
ncbi:hypothetical protein N0V82_000523 [Gnomoniopsis sp. IMI 355080]|nr:hypothetical protein N0V82_000523 [Gnomoniopsis sp. IMI 355080]